MSNEDLANIATTLMADGKGISRPTRPSVP
jgi:hypothetical protein